MPDPQISEKIAYQFELISASFHEAGHALYALLHYMMVYSSRVFVGQESQRVEGLTSVYPLINLEDITDPVVLSKRLNSEIAFYYAGLIAEKEQFKLHSGSDKLPIILNGGSGENGDIKNISNLIKKYQIAPPGAKRYNFKKKMMRRVTKELQKYWSDVTLIAHALFQKKRLNFKKLQFLLIKKSENKEFWKVQLKTIVELYDKSPLNQQEIKMFIV